MVEFYVRDIETALENRCYFTALALSLALPDICGTAEYPNESSTAKRYIEWYNAYAGESRPKEEVAPYLSGEIVYNLRNTFLHTGSPNIDHHKVKDEANQVDKFMLVLGDGTKFWSFSAYVETPIVTYRAITVDISYLCNLICDCALWYYQHNKNKFRFDFEIDTQEHLFASDFEMPTGDPVIQALNQKLKKNGSTKQYVETPGHSVCDSISDGLHQIFSNETLRQKWENGETITLQKGRKPHITKSTSPQFPEIKQTASDRKRKIPKLTKREAQVRSFFGQHFKEKKFKQKKEQIIQAVLTSKTKQQVNNALMKHFSSDETGVIYKRVLPLLKDYPGK